MSFSSRGRQLNQASPSNGQIAFAAGTELSTQRDLKKNAMRQQLQANPQFTQQLQSLLQTQEDMDILNELFTEMNTGRGGKRSKKSNKRRRTLKKRTLRRRRY